MVLSTAHAAESDPRRRAALVRLLAERRSQAYVVARPRDGGTFPCMPAQRRIWLAGQLAVAAVPNATFGLRLTGELRPAALAHAVAAVVDRHESMRTVYCVQSDGTPRQRVLPAVSADLVEVDLTGESPEAAQRWAAQAAAERFDPAHGPLFRVNLLRLGHHDHALLFVGHHIAFDEHSIDIVRRDLAAAYAHVVGMGPPLLPVRLQYADYAAWAEESTVDAVVLGYWRERFAHPQPEFPLGGTATGGTASLRTVLPAGTLDRLRGRERGVTPFMTLMAVLKVVMSRYLGSDDVTVGTVSSGRDRVELEPIVGCFLNPVALRTDLSQAVTFGDVLGLVRTTVLEAFARPVPFERVVAEAGAASRSGRHPLFQVALNLHQYRGELGAWPGLRAEIWHHEVGADALDLTVEATPLPDGGAELTFRYPVGAVAPDAVERFAGHFRSLGEQLAPERSLESLDAPDAELLRRFNDTAVEVPAGTVLDSFHAQVSRTPDDIAITGPDGELTYVDLSRRVDALAARLRAAGVGPGSLVAVSLERSTRLVVATLAVWRAGAAYVPIDPEYPAARREFVLADCAAPVVLTEPALADRFPSAAVLLVDDLAGTGDGLAPFPSDVAYVLYTSGSTGRPKGVVVEHRALTNLVEDMRRRLSAAPEHRWLAVTSLAFDIAALELFLPLVSGGRVVVAPEPAGRDGNALATLIERSGVTHVQTTPSRWRLLVAAGFADPAVTGLVGGEALPSALARDLRARVGRLVNVYGPTETTIWSTAWEVPPEGTDVLIGRPLANTRVSIRDGRGRSLPVGVPGEMCIGGAGLARGYLHRPELTADRFRPDPDGPPGSRLYRTGDRARWRPDGQLEFLGRLDDQVKVDGHRIEPGEIEARLGELHGVTEAAVVVHGERTLVAYVVAAEGDPSSWRRALEGVLPRYMIPAEYVRLDRLPLTPNGKLDRAALPSPTIVIAATPPRTPTEKLVAGVWGAELGRDGIGTEDDFFALGGHSLLAMSVAARLSVECGREVGVQLLFQHPTVAELAAAIDGSAAGVGRPLVRRAVDEAPLSVGQERLWFLDQLDPGDPAYNMYLVYRLRGPLNAEALADALTTVVDRHEVLRTRYVERDGSAVQVASTVELRLTLVEGDLAEARRQVAEWTNAPFDLAVGPPIRAGLVRMAAEDHVFCLVLHHIAGDGRSLGLILEELRAGYTGLPLADLPVQYADYAAWQRAESVDDSGLDYWRGQLSAVPPLDLPTDRPRPAVRSSRGAFVRLEIPADVADALERLATENRCSLFMVLLAAYQALLGRYAGQDDVCVGTSIEGRPRPELRDLVGLFVNTLALRGDLSGDPTFRELLERTRATALAAYAHQHIPFERLAAELDLARDLSRTPLFQTMLILHTEDGAGTEVLPGLQAEFFDDGYRQAKFDLMLDLWRESDGIAVSVNYSADLFDEATMVRFGERFHRFLSSIVDDADQRLSSVDLTAPGERENLLDLGDGGAGAEPEDVVDLVRRRATLAPSDVAISCGDRDLTYAELVEQADWLAALLGTKPGNRVAVALPRSPELIVALLAILQTGAAYVPIDLDYPQERIDFLLADCGAKVMVGVDGVLSMPSTATDLGELAYVIYTSGSSGVPKGVGVSRRALAARVAWMRQAYALSEVDKVVQFASVSFDAHVEEIWPALASGARLVLLPPGEQLPDLLAGPRGAGVTVLDLPTPYWHELIGQLDRVRWPEGLRLLILGADQIRPDALGRWFDRFGDRVTVFNTYGPTEATVIASAARLDRSDVEHRPPIGRPIGDTRLYVLDDALRLVPSGIPGELCIGGAGVARGYLGRPELTADRFLPDPYGPSGTRLYRTGDRVRWRADGQLEFLGRLDDQVKVRGYRVEPGEVEAALAAQPGVEQAVVVARPDSAGHLTLVGYAAGRALDPAALRAGLTERLPQFLVPSHIIVVDRIPLTPNGKVDRRALPEPGTRVGGYVPPRTPTEELVAQVWAGVLGIDRVGAEDDFFALGGHSLLALDVTARLGSAVGREVPVRALFAESTVAGLATVVDRLDAAVPTPLVRSGRHEFPLSYGQERLWFLHQLDPDDGSYNIHLTYRLRGRVDADLLERALNAVVARHDSLQTRYVLRDGEPVAVVQPTYVAIHRTEGAVAAFAQAPFDLAKDSPIRAGLFRLDDDEHVLCIVVHHIAFDGRSAGVFVAELREAYAGGGVFVEAEPAVQYGDFAEWQRARPIDGATVAYWRDQLAGVSPLDFPTDRARPAMPANSGDFLEVWLPDPLVREVRRVAAEARCTTFMVLLAAYQVLLGRWTGQDDVPVGSPAENRPRAELAGLIGFFVNTLVLRGDLSGDPSFRQLLARTRTAALGAYAQQDLPFDRLLTELAAPRDPGRSPLFQTMFAVHTEAAAGTDVLPDVAAEFFDIPFHQVKYDLTLDVWRDERGMRLVFGYRTELFDRSTIAALAERYTALVSALVATPDRPMSTVDALGDETDRARLSAASRPAARAWPEPTPSAVYVPPATDAEELVAAVWTDVLGLARVGTRDDFFAIGGHSLLAMKVIARLRAMADVDVPLRTLFTHTVLADLAVAVEELIVAELEALSDEEAAAMVAAGDGAVR